MKIFAALVLLMPFQSVLYAQKEHHYKNEKHIYVPQANRVINLFPDSIRMEFPEHNILIVAQASDLDAGTDVLKTLNELLGELVTQIESSYPKNEKNSSYRVDVGFDLNGFKEILITEKKESATQLLVKEKQIFQLLPPGWEIHITHQDHKLYIYAEDIKNLKKLTQPDFDLIHSRLAESRSFITRRKSVKSRFIVRNSAIEYDEVKYSHPLDMISFTAGAGAGVLRNKIFPEINGTIGLHIADRFNRYNHKIEVSYSSMYFANQNAEGGFSNNISSFLSLAYSKNIGGKGDRPAWAGFGAGLLVQQAGDFDFFIGKTMKFFLITDMGSNKFTVMPEFYLTNDFKKIALGLKINYRF